jgi:putative transposase
VRYACVDRRRNHYSIRMMCALLRVSRSGYYAWRGRPESATKRRNRQLTDKIRSLHAASGGVYGSPKIHQQLVASGESCGRHKVAKLMRQAGLRGCPKKRYRSHSSPAVAVKAANLLQQDFSAEQSNERWVSDITYIPTRQGWLYLAVVMDLYSRRIIGWSMSRRIDRHLALKALNMALGQRCVAVDLIHHSDRGAQYLSDDYQALLKKHGIRCSLSGAGSCYDNAAAESFFGLLKRERVNRVRYRTREEARSDVFDYIERFYNRQRSHSYLGYNSPVEFERQAVGA